MCHGQSGNVQGQDCLGRRLWYFAFSYSKLIQALSNLISQFAGLGCLSIFAARAGAKKVYAVEASRQTFELALGAFAKSGLDSIIEAINAPIEEAVIGDRFVDIIISEWMGYW